jgi:hypothetical protein
MNHTAMHRDTLFHIDVSTVTVTTAICRPHRLLLATKLHSRLHCMTLCTTHSVLRFLFTKATVQRCGGCHPRSNRFESQPAIHLCWLVSSGFHMGYRTNDIYSKIGHGRAMLDPFRYIFHNCPQ